MPFETLHADYCDQIPDTKFRMKRFETLHAEYRGQNLDSQFAHDTI